MTSCKEYLEKQPDGTYSLVLRGDLCKDDDIEVPEGMNYAYDAGSFIQFTKQEMGYRDSILVWQRELRAMVNPMKEYLDANRNYEFVLSTEKDDGFIEIPEGAIRARFYPNDPDALEFEGDFCQWWHDKDNEWINYENYSNTLKHSRVVWQRDQDEPFLTPECTLNDQYAEIEQVRQAIKVKSGSDSDHALDAMSFALMGAGAASGGAKDNVNHPNHYTQGKVECLDALESATIGKSGIEAVCVANVIKYLWRYEEKNGVEDVKKAQFYLNRLLATLEN